MEHIPSHLISLVETRPFHTLNAEEQKEALQYFSSEEYTQMHLAATLVKGMHAEHSSREAVIRETLLSHFDRRHGSVRQKWSPAKITPGKVAAVFLLLGFVGLQYLLLSKQQQKPALAFTDHDTVYLIKEIPAKSVKETDTVYIIRKEKRSPGDHRHNLNLANLEDSGLARPMPVLNDVNIVSVDELNDKRNSRRGNSIKEDTLIKQIGFVTL